MKLLGSLWHRLLAIGVLFVLAAISAEIPAADELPLVLAVVPRMPATITHRDWSPFAHALARDIGRAVELRVFNTFPEFEEFVFSGRADLVFSNPYNMVQLKQRTGAVALVRDRSRNLSGILVVGRNDAARLVKDLDGASIAFPHPNAFGASLYMRAQLEAEHGIHFTPTYVTTHGNVYRSVILGKARAGGGVNVTLNKEPAAVRDQLRVIYTTPAVPAHPLSAHPRVGAALRDKIVAAVLNLAGTEPGRAILAQVTLDEPVRADYDKDYKPLERLGLDKYYVNTEIPEP
jgi:phosphonate transport system substrate-binding protein